MSAPIVVEAAVGCGGTPVLLFALEELGVPYTILLRPSGYFLSKHGRPGPMLRVGGSAHLGLTEALASLANDRERAVIEARRERFEPPMHALLTNREDTAARHALEGALDALAEALGERKFAFDVPTIADAFALVLRSLPKLGIELSRWPTLEAYRERMMSRAAWTRATARMAELDPERVLRFWFGDAPAATEEAVFAKVKRWFRGGAELDGEITALFSRTIVAALAGELDAWASTPRGRLALVLVLDQFTRNVFRDTPRAYAGDARAQELVLEANATDLALEERVFMNMPLVHAEDRMLQGRAVREAERIVDSAPSELRTILAMSIEQATKYCGIIARFGRFPHRNAILGRTSSAAEEAFLADWSQKAAPARMRAG